MNKIVRWPPRIAERQRGIRPSVEKRVKRQPGNGAELVGTWLRQIAEIVAINYASEFV